MSLVGDITPAPAGAGPLPGPSGVAALSLLLANTGMLFLFFYLDLSLYQVVVVYWFEALWIGLFSGLKLLTASLIGDPFENRWVEVSAGGGLLLSLIAIAKAGGTFLGILLLTGVGLAVAHQGLTGLPGDDFAAGQGMLLLKCSLLFFAGHGLSFVINFLVLREYRHARFLPLIWLPFKRALALFVMIGIGVLTIARWPDALDATTFPAVLIGIKLGWDFFLHRRERLAFARRTPTIDG